jgi:uncharacterized protein (TIGR03067 family)
MLTAPLLLALTLAPADASAPPDGPPPPAVVRVDDAGELKGTWEVVACFFAGKDESTTFKGGRLVFTGTSLRFVDPSGKDFGPYLFRVDAARDPSEVDEVTERGPPEKCIYRRTGNELLWAEDISGEGRPSSIKPAPGVFVWTLRRVKT